MELPTQFNYSPRPFFRLGYFVKIGQTKKLPDKVSPCSDNIREVPQFSGRTENGLRACMRSATRPLEVYFASNDFYPLLSDGDSHAKSVDGESKSISC